MKYVLIFLLLGLTSCERKQLKCHEGRLYQKSGEVWLELGAG